MLRGLSKAQIFQACLSQGEFIQSIQKGDEIDKPCDLGYRDKNVEGSRPPRLADQQRYDVEQPHHKSEDDSGGNGRIAACDVHLQD